MGTPAPGPPPRTAPAPPRPPPCAPGAARGRRTRPRAQLGADRSRHPEADEAPMQPTGPTSSGPWPTRWPGSPDLANFFRIGQPFSNPDQSINSPNRYKDMRMLSRPLAPQGQEVAAFTDGRPGGVAETGDPTERGRIAKTEAAPRERTGSVADQPPPEQPAMAAATTAAVAEPGAAAPADNGPTPAAPEGAAVAVTRHREHRFPGRRRPVQVRFGEEEFAAIELAAGRAGLTPTGYVGAVALAAARGTVPPPAPPPR